MIFFLFGWKNAVRVENCGLGLKNVVWGRKLMFGSKDCCFGLGLSKKMLFAL